MGEKIGVLLLILTNWFGTSLAFWNFALCDQQVYLYAEQSRSLYSPLWPSLYLPGSSCRYQIVAPVDSQIQVTCSIKLEDPSCWSEKFYVSTSGDADINSAEIFCGTTSFTKTSIGNKLMLAYVSDYYRGQFRCTLTSVCDCGWGLKSRIVGGEETIPNEFPSMAGLVTLGPKPIIYCGGTIVSSLYVVTAAHCVDGRFPIDSAVVVGEHDVTTGADTSATRLHRILRYIKHPNYVKKTESNDNEINDVALVHTITSIVFSRAVGPVCLPFLYSFGDFSGYDVIATGWGSTEFGGPRSNYTQKVDLTVLKNDDSLCQSIYPNIESSQMCTFKENKDTCQFDSGGPLYYSGTTGSRAFLVGQVSSGVGCGSNAPALNSRMTSFMKWIEGYTGTLCKRQIQ